MKYLAADRLLSPEGALASRKWSVEFNQWVFKKLC